MLFSNSTVQMVMSNFSRKFAGVRLNTLSCSNYGRFVKSESVESRYNYSELLHVC